LLGFLDGGQFFLNRLEIDGHAVEGLYRIATTHALSPNHSKFP
jgi:hypothetical protein